MQAGPPWVKVLESKISKESEQSKYTVEATERLRRNSFTFTVPRRRINNNGSNNLSFLDLGFIFFLDDSPLLDFQFVGKLVHRIKTTKPSVEIANSTVDEIFFFRRKVNRNVVNIVEMNRRGAAKEAAERRLRISDGVLRFCVHHCSSNRVTKLDGLRSHLNDDGI